MFEANHVHLPISLDTIRSQVTDLQLFEKYCDNFKAVGKKMKSQFYNDKNPSAYIFIKGPNNLGYFDHGNGDSLDPIGFIQKKYTCTFIEALNIIQSDFRLSNALPPQIKGNYLIGRESVYNVTKTALNTMKKKTSISTIERNFSLWDLRYWWRKYEITFDTLDLFDVKPLELVDVETENGRWQFKSKREAPMYSYKEYNAAFQYVGLRIYNPLSENKWMNSTDASIIQGVKQVDFTKDTIILSKSLKDVMELYLMGFTSIAPYNESGTLNDGIVNIMNEFEKKYILFDNDETGIKASKELNEKYGWKELFIPIESGYKDISDFTEMYSLEEGEQLINKLIGK